MVIDVDASAPWTLPDARTGRGRHPVPTFILIVLAVLAVLTGPTALRTTTLTLAWQVKASTRFFWLTPAAVYSLDDAGGGVVLLSAHERGNQRVVWRLPIRGPLAEAYTAANPLISTDLPPSSAAGVRTSITEEDSTIVYPAAAVPLVYLTDDLIIIIDRDLSVPPLSGYGASQNGLQWTYVVTVRDLATRQVRWSRRLDPGVRWALPGVRAGSAGIVGLPAGAEWMVTDSVGGDVDVWDLRTGDTRASRLVGSLDGHAFVTALPDAVLVSQPDAAGDDLLTAYDPVTLTPLWRLRPPLTRAEPVWCDPQLCLVTHRAVWIVDPRTSLVIARVNGDDVRPGPPGQAVVAPFGENTAVIATGTGMDRPIDGVWRVVDATAYSATAVVVQVHPLGHADLGLLDVARASVIRLGPTNQWSAYYDCLATDQSVACDDGSTLSVWRRGSR